MITSLMDFLDYTHQLRKKCSGCGVEKGLSEFGKDKQKRGGLTCKCKACKREDSRLWIAKKREVDPRYGRKWSYENKDKTRLINKEYNKRNPERHKKYRLKNPHWYKAASHKFRAKQRGIDSSLTGSDILAALKDQCGLCAICQCDISKKYTIDHVVPLIRGGDNSPENVQLLCRGCNARKGKLLNSEFLSILLSYNYIG